jgi:hypothetical protein
MKSFSTNLIAALMIGSLATSAFACGGGGNRGGNINRNNNRNNQTCNNNGGYNQGGGYNNGGYENYGQAYEPFHSTYICQPGDSFYTVSLKEYGTSSNMKHIASYNRMATNAALVPGMRLMLPSISAGGRLSASRAPAAEGYATSPYATSTANFVQPTATPVVAPVTMSPIATEPERVSIPTGSTLQLDGESLGADAGVVRLRISGVAMPVEVVEWNTASTKIRLPKLDVTGATKAELEVVRADGTLASTNAISLTSAASSVAAN